MKDFNEFIDRLNGKDSDKLKEMVKASYRNNLEQVKQNSLIGNLSVDVILDILKLYHDWLNEKD